MAVNAVRTMPGGASALTGYQLPANPPFIQAGINIDDIAAVRNGLLDKRHAAYCLANRRFANPKGEQLIGIYGASGPDIATVLLSTDAHQVFCVDRLSIDIRNLKKQRSRMGRLPKDLNQRFSHLIHREDCLWYAKDFKDYREQLIMYELKSMGVRRSSIKIGFDGLGNPVVTFPWAFPGQREKEREFTYLKADMTKPRTYPEMLKLLMSAAVVDFYYEKSSMYCHHAVEDYLPGMSEAVRRFILIGPSASNEAHVVGSGRLGAMLEGEFAPVNAVNMHYWKYFIDPPDPDKRLMPYFWRVDLWKRMK